MRAVESAGIVAARSTAWGYSQDRDKNMYHQFDEAAVRALLGIGPEDAPLGLIVHGTYNLPERVRRWRDRLSNARAAPNAFNLVIGEHQGVTLWYAPVLGSPMVAFVAHCAGVLGVKGIVQIGSFGGTRKGLEVGDLLLVTGAGRGDGASDWYLPKDVPARADEAWTNWFRGALAGRGLTWHEGRVFTTPAFMAEKWEDILRWESEGYAGVEMEAATTLAIAQHFGVPSACLIYLLDNLIEERHLLDNTKEERERIRASRALVEELALEAILSLA